MVALSTLKPACMAFSTTGTWTFAVSLGSLLVSWGTFRAVLLGQRFLTGHLQDAAPESIDLRGVLAGKWSFLHWCAYHGYARAVKALPQSLVVVNGSSRTEGHWTPLHGAATQGHEQATRALVLRGAPVDAVNAAGHTGLMIAAARWHTGVVQALLQARANPNVADSKGFTPLHFAVGGADVEVVKRLLHARADLEATNGDGATPLVTATEKEARWPVAKLLLQNGTSANVKTHSRGLTPLMQVICWSSSRGPEAVQLLLRMGADVAEIDRFGSTALHAACRLAPPETIAALCGCFADPLAQDNDGLYPLQLLTERCAKAPDDSALVELAMAAILTAAQGAAVVKDFGDFTALHTLCLHAGMHKTVPHGALRKLLAARADPLAEEEGGWTPVHFAAQAGGEVSDALISEICMAAAGRALDGWAAVDLGKKRDASNRKYLSRRGGHHRIPLEDRLGVLQGDLSLAGVAQRLQSGRSRRVVALIGAGASTSAGIPDFRSPGTGLWANAETTRIFSQQGFHSEPERFWRHAAGVFLGRQPTPVHRFLAALARGGLLQRIYTQNIDGLEVEAGVPPELLIECHGNVLRTVCDGDPSHCIPCSSIVDVLAHLNAGHSAPRCATCRALVRPDVVFFGESLPTVFGMHSGRDMQDCDLLLVIGTTLNVYPVAGLVSQALPLTPRVLFNREPVGPWRKLSNEGSAVYRDVFYQGEVDDGVEELARLLGWDV
mmetsp:Transcript_66124/g.166764  ORF Transcript_66124/g.166764 Transcript_66124/m.166764 type:complete len:723 (+) Transcript_66124:122-2290(+)